MTTGNRTLVALVDDDVHSARLLSRSLNEAGLADVRWLGDADRSNRLLCQMAALGGDDLPGLLIVDLKAHSRATAAFIAGLGDLGKAAEMPVVAIAATPDEAVRNALLAAGADAVFERHAEIDAYRREAARIARYWARSARLQATGS